MPQMSENHATKPNSMLVMKCVNYLPVE